MLGKFFPECIKKQVRKYIDRHIKYHLEAYERKAIYFASHPGDEDYWISDKSIEEKRPDAHEPPIPPPELWMGYGQGAEKYISVGKKHVDDMIKILEDGEFAINNSNRIMEFGCAAGRMIRHLPQLAPNAELWGVDISAKHIRWCIDNLTPTINFVTTTLLPHLPFEDRFFDLVFCGSVFTHIEDIAETWLQELGRVIRPGGRLYITIHDENTVKQFDSKLSDHPFAKRMLQNQVYRDNRDKFDMIVIGRMAGSQVFYNSRYFRKILPPCFRWVSYTPEIYGYQSAVVLEKLMP